MLSARAMSQIERGSRILRDLGIFILALVAIVIAMDYLFRPNPYSDMEQVVHEILMRSAKRASDDRSTGAKGQMQGPVKDSSGPRKE